MRPAQFDMLRHVLHAQCSRADFNLHAFANASLLLGCFFSGSLTLLPPCCFNASSSSASSMLVPCFLDVGSVLQCTRVRSHMLLLCLIHVCSVLPVRLKSLPRALGSS